MPFAIDRNDYSHRDYSDTLAGAIVRARGWAPIGAWAVLYDGDIAHACSDSCLTELVADLDLTDRVRIALGSTDDARRNGRSGRYDDVPCVIVDETDENLWCGNCNAQIDDRFGDCLLCDGELIRYQDGSENGFYFGTTHYANDDRFGGICADCLPMYELTSTRANGAPMGWDELDSDTAEHLTGLYGPDYAARITTAFAVYAFHDPRTMRGEREAAVIEVLGGPRDYSRGNLRDDRVWHIIRREIIRRTRDARGIMELPGVEWSTLDAPLDIPGEWFGPNRWDAQGFALAVCGLVPESV